MNDKYLTVSQINHYIKSRLDNDPNLQMVYLKGEISNFKNHTSGHLYFTLKDSTSRIMAVMFKNNAIKLNFKPMDGAKVLVVGKISAYEANGNYQIYVTEMIEDGIGNLYLEFEKLKKSLEQKGYFRTDIKKAIPKFPKKIGIITASTGAAIKDIITTINRRYPLVNLYIFPSLVQGDGAKEDLVKNIKLADKYGLDLIILGRGGGSIEDLWCFNEEVVANAIYQAITPIISAVGHEIDYTISDFVADLRAPTPTAAAELAVPNMIDLKTYLKQLEIRATNSLNNNIRRKKEKLLNITSAYVLKNPSNIYEIKAQKLDNLVEKIEIFTKNKLTSKTNRYLNVLNKLETLNPILTIKRGYAIVKKDEEYISSIKTLKNEENIKIELKDGIISSKITSLEEF